MRHETAFQDLAKIPSELYFLGVPKYLLKNSQHMNGTSMACPNAVGASACLLSAMKAASMQISPFLFRLAIENTAKLQNFPEENEQQNRFAYGFGLIQIDSGLFLIKNESFVTFW